ncbi:MAG TPA: hypothetical protein PLG27_09445, partial [Candidatus Latescibacteria bacterium]|nr:hypothetical protein [Candidatus Latescibacterota bacterium]
MTHRESGISLHANARTYINGRVGLRLARHIARDCQVKLIEASAPRCEYLSTELAGRALVLHGDSTDE